MDAQFDRLSTSGVGATETTQAPKVAVDGLRVEFLTAGRPFVAVEDVSFDVGEGEVVCLLGPSGCGKSTVLRTIAGFIPPSAGRVAVDGNVAARPGPDRGMVFQDHGLFPWLTARRNVEFGIRNTVSRSADRRAVADRWLERMHLSGFADVLPAKLSGGMRQRVAIARALAPEPAVLLMDEPFAALDAQTRMSMQEMLADLIAGTGCTVVFVTHDIDEALIVGDRILVMSRAPGRIIEDLRNPFDRPRSSLIFDQDEYGHVKSRILHQIRDQIIEE